MSLDWSNVKALSIPVGGVARDVKRVSVGGTVLWEKAPAVPYDALVQYVESDGTQYIDTGIAAAGDLRIVADAQFLDIANTPGLFGTVASARFDLVVNNNNRRWEPGYNSAYSSSTVAADTNRHMFEMTNAFSLDGSPLWTATAATFTAEDMLVFALRRPAPNTVRNYASARLYSMKIWKANTLVRDFVPVRVGSGASAVGYLYDRANPTGGPSGNGLYGNSGSGAFVIGPDKTT